MEPFTREKLDSPEWAPYRRSIIAAKGNICVHCGEIAKYPFLQPIRLVPGLLPWKYELDNIQISCFVCHYRGRGGISEFLQLLREFSAEDQMLLIDIAKVVLEKGPSEREVAAERIRSQSKAFLVLSQEVDYYLREKKSELNAALISCDPATIDSLTDFLELTDRIPCGERLNFLKGLRSQMQEPVAESDRAEEVDNYSAYNEV